MDDKITIVEGPTPTFEIIPDVWAHGLVEGFHQAEIVATRLRAFNGDELVERCRRAWHNRQNIYLEYRSSEGLPAEVPIVAARNLQTEDGDVLLLWLRFPDDSVEIGIDNDDDEDDFFDDDDWGLEGF
jgi:hypothetical protein